jgi:hypothetical protein
MPEGHTVTKLLAAPMEEAFVWLQMEEADWV